jgi:ribose/xylose/arabinose/galactoside ABC-type transport system permease subunit
MVILDVDQSYNKIVMGAAIIVAVVVDQAKSKMMK